jgi:hypothetical protein
MSIDALLRTGSYPGSSASVGGGSAGRAVAKRPVMFEPELSGMAVAQRIMSGMHARVHGTGERSIIVAATEATGIS